MEINLYRITNESKEMSFTKEFQYHEGVKEGTFGTVSAKSSNVMRPAGFPATSHSKNTFGFFPAVVLIHRLAAKEEWIRKRDASLALSIG